MTLITEASRNELISKSKSSSKGRQRFNRRNKSRVANTVKAMNSIDMNKLFKQDILTVNIPVKGETDDYIVRITFGGFLEILRDQIQGAETIDFRAVSRAAIIGFNKGDVFIHCSCPDWAYRFAYYASRNDINSGTEETRPSDITNPDDKLGSACKHVLLVLNNTSWIIRVARVITNYIHYMERHYNRLYADIIFPAVFGREYEDPVQLTFDDPDELASDSDTDVIDDANAEASDRGKFKQGNTSGVRFASKPEDSDQLEIENDDDVM